MVHFKGLNRLQAGFPGGKLLICQFKKLLLTQQSETLLKEGKLQRRDTKSAEDLRTTLGLFKAEDSGPSQSGKAEAPDLEPSLGQTKQGFGA